ncbi:hypothetical protein EYF80_002660 [Liparis tanakae]|uniref:Uncharacterized protein n=1 Tax=Liparis tanakae TaxID=230148 RepID=A0A4Z2J962_9TELE|nr:hypothetical protein EYF80_002660 [Liparis tanakae]
MLDADGWMIRRAVQPALCCKLTETVNNLSLGHDVNVGVLQRVWAVVLLQGQIAAVRLHNKLQ